MYRKLNLLKLNNIVRLNLYKLLRLLLDGELPEFWQLLLANYVTQHEYNTRRVGFRHSNIVCELERRALSYQLILMLDNLLSYFLETNFKISLRHFERALLEEQWYLFLLAFYYLVLSLILASFLSGLAKIAFLCN